MCVLQMEMKREALLFASTSVSGPRQSQRTVCGSESINFRMLGSLTEKHNLLGGHIGDLHCHMLLSHHQTSNIGGNATKVLPINRCVHQIRCQAPQVGSG